MNFGRAGNVDFCRSFALYACGCNTEREKTAPGVRVSVQLEFGQSCSVEQHGIAGGIIAKPDVSISLFSHLVSWPA